MFGNYPSQILVAVENMNQVFDTPEKRKYVADKARLHLSDKTKSDLYSEAYACLLNELGINTRIQDEYTQKLVVFYFEAQKKILYGVFYAR
ncbi:hypothetical protein CGSSp14BS69_06792 [Streptococcus pneumoniae SP14-BS69]|nr:hypothetical protein CGSSp14BS69_06792 [Streptococcus pneumoniae SP14-BS69]